MKAKNTKELLTIINEDFDLTARLNPLHRMTLIQALQMGLILIGARPKKVKDI